MPSCVFTRFMRLSTHTQPISVFLQSHAKRDKLVIGRSEKEAFYRLSQAIPYTCETMTTTSYHIANVAQLTSSVSESHPVPFAPVCAAWVSWFGATLYSVPWGALRGTGEAPRAPSSHRPIAFAAARLTRVVNASGQSCRCRCPLSEVLGEGKGGVPLPKIFLLGTFGAPSARAFGAHGLVGMPEVTRTVMFPPLRFPMAHR